jgi:4-amino-4-deoxy-L-arabinose transferase-like glycosyltransferase
MKLFLIIGYLFLVISLFLFAFNKKQNLQFVLLLIGSFCIFLAYIFLDPFLNVWDERFHALVAKNLMSNPLTPSLYPEICLTSVGHNHWVNDYIWLHKQPLFLWQIALSYKIFGVNEYALRIPSLLMSTALVYIFYATGKLLQSHKLGYFMALLLTSNYCLGSLMSGNTGMEHNDVAFMFYISLSIFLVAKNCLNEERRNAVLIGFVIGLAVLTKWLVGLIGFAIWAMYLIQEFVSERKINYFKILNFIIAFIVCLITFLPWQFYIFDKFPTEALREQLFNMKHFTEVIENHGGDSFYYIDGLNVLFGRLNSMLIFMGIYFLILSKKLLRIKIALLLGAVLVFVFFTIAKTKMPMYTFSISISLILFLAFAYIKVYNLARIHLNGIIVAILFSLVILFNINPKKLTRTHSEFTNYWKDMTENTKLYKSIKLDPNEKAIVFNCRGFHYVDVMFYNENTIAYNFIPSKEQIAESNSKNRKIYIFNKDSLPEYIRVDPNISIIQGQERSTAD